MKNLGNTPTVSEDIVNKDYLETRHGLPSYARSLSLLGSFNSRLGLYIASNDSFGAVRAAIGRAVTANATNPYARLAFFGDSHTEAKMDDTTGASTAGWGYAWPDVVRRLLIAAGVPDGGTGWQKPASQITTLDTRYWTGSTGTWTGRTGQIVTQWATTTSAGNTLTFELPNGGGVAVDILTRNNDKPLSYTIYNSSAVSISTGTITGDTTSTLKVTTISGLTDAQKLVLTTSGSVGTTWKVGPCQIRRASGLLVSNFGTSNTAAMAGTPYFGWSNPTTGATYDYIGSEMLACVPDADLVGGTLGGNDILAGSSVSTLITDLTTIYNRWPDASKLHVTNWPGGVNQSAYIAAYMAMMDTLGGAVLDNFYRDGNYTLAASRNLYKNSATIHVDEAAHEGCGRAIVDAITSGAGASTGGSSGVSSFNTRTGAVSLTKADVTGLGWTADELGAANAVVAAWAGSTSYATGQYALLPTGGRGYRTTAGTSASTWTAAERDAWTFEPGAHYESLAPGVTSWKCPVGIKQAQFRICASGGAGGGGGSSATAAINSGGGGGAAADPTNFTVAVTAGTSYTTSIGASPTGGNGGAAGGGAGTRGNDGIDTTIVIGATTYRSRGGGGGNQGLASSTAAVNGGLYGYPTGTAGTGTIGPGNGGIAGSGLNGCVPQAGMIGGTGGVSATTTLGGNGGSARTTPGQALPTPIGQTANKNGGAGTAATLPGCGGGGGGGGCGTTGTGGAGGAGGPGIIEAWF